MSIQRWSPFDPMALMGRHEDGTFVTYSDHIAAVLDRDKRWEVAVAGIDNRNAEAYLMGQRDERERIVKAVEVWAARSAYGLKSWDGLFAVIDGGES